MWLHRLVYFPDLEIYDLIPEYKFPLRTSVEDRNGGLYEWAPEKLDPNLEEPVTYRNHGTIVQPVRFWKEEDAFRNCLGVRIICVTNTGEMCWWRVKKDNVMESKEDMDLEEIIF